MSDPGHAVPRTALAWQRTGLSLLVATVVLARLTGGQLGLVAWTAGGVCAALALGVVIVARRRGAPDGGWGGGPAAATAGCVVLLAAWELVALAR